LNRLEIATLASACLVLIGGIMFYVDQFPYPWQKMALSQAIIAMIATCTFAVIASMIIHMRAIYLKRSRLRMTNDKKSSLARLESARDLVATAPV
jgi:cytochrome b subunit of formate dehydrogenase